MKESKSLLDLDFKTKDGQKFDVPVHGSLGLLALGDIGLMAWREKKLQVYQEMQKQKAQKEQEK